MKSRLKWVLGGGCFLLFAITIFLFVFRETILVRAGHFMAPGGNYVADVAILEGTEFLDRNIVMTGMNLLSSGRVKRIIVVLHRIAPADRPFAFNEDYPHLVRQEMEALGIKGRDFRIIVTHIHEPITLTSARGALEIISKEHVKSAILVSPGFHARRSYLVYQHLCIPLHIRIFPFACFHSYQPDHWWSEEGGLRDFAEELLKLAYYLARGYIPLRLTY
jgi:uncharacterized SAM-binding protein YcdF (DUF218 family)